MANTFKRYTTNNIGAVGVTCYTVPSSTTSVVINGNISNLLNEQIEVSVQMGGAYLIKNAQIPAGSSIQPFEGKPIMETTDTIVVTSNRSSSADLHLSVLEQT